MLYSQWVHKTTVTLPDDVHLRVRALAERADRTVSDAVVELLAEALAARARGGFASHGAGEADVDDLGVNAEKYLAEGMR